MPVPLKPAPFHSSVAKDTVPWRKLPGQDLLGNGENSVKDSGHLTTKLVTWALNLVQNLQREHEHSSQVALLKQGRKKNK